MRRVISLAVVLCLANASPAADPVEDGKVALIGYAANFQSFSTYRVKFKHTKASADSEEAALAGRWRNATTATVLYIVDGEFEKLECDAGPPPKLPSGKDVQGPQFISVPFTSWQYVAGGPGAAGYTTGLGAVNLFRKESGELGMEQATPLALWGGHQNRSGPDRKAADGAVYATDYLGRKVIDGQELVGVRCARRQGDGTWDYWFDPARGYLPARSELITPSKRVRTMRLLAARECSGGRWFPERILWTIPKKLGQPEVSVDEIQILALDADSKPNPDDFYIKVPAGTQVLFQDRQGFIKLKQDETIYARDLPELFEMTDKGIDNPLTDTGLQHLADRRRSWWWVCIALGILLLLVGVTRVVRRRSPASPS